MSVDFQKAIEKCQADWTALVSKGSSCQRHWCAFNQTVYMW